MSDHEIRLQKQARCETGIIKHKEIANLVHFENIFGDVIYNKFKVRFMQILALLRISSKKLNEMTFAGYSRKLEP